MQYRIRITSAAIALTATGIGIWLLAEPAPRPAPPVIKPLTTTVKIPTAPSRPQTPLTDQFAVPVLMYHRVADLNAKETRNPLMRDLTVSPAKFEEQVRHLSENGFTFLFASEVETAVLEGKALPERAIAITMDDGYADNFEQAFPILRKYGAKATIFLVTNTLDKAGHLTWDNCRTMQPEGVGYGSHTVHHYELPSLSVAEMDRELRDSKQTIEFRLSAPVTSVAYPSGAYNQTVASRAEAAGYLAGWKKGGGPVQPGMNAYLLPRVRVNGENSMADFKRKVYSGAYVLADRRDATRKFVARLARHRSA
jgi:peptidoglycan/xylan/chitin deacetylase (PgdA/CDA1 family)